MTSLAIRADGLGKKYRIGRRQAEPYSTLRDAIMRRFSGGDQGGGEDFWALRDVNFEVKHGEVVGIIGRNGAGKSTLLKILSRITEPTEGRVAIRGRVGSLLEVGTGFHPELTGRENVYLNGAILGMRRAEIRSKFDEIVAFSEVERFLDTPVKRYSSGMFVRLAFAVAAHLEPEVLVVDEVLAVGDMAFQKKCLGKMESVSRREGRTVLFVSHNMSAVTSLCQRAILLEQGQIVADGRVETVVDRYLKTPVGPDESGRLPASAHCSNTGEFWIERVVLLGKDGQPAPQLRMMEAASIHIAFEVRQPVQQVRIGCGFATLDGTRIATVHHTDGGNPPLDLDRGRYKIVFSFRNPLLPGHYHLSAGAHRALVGATIDYVPQALQFQVVEVADGASPFEAHNNGLIRLETEWSLPVRLE